MRMMTHCYLFEMLKNNCKAADRMSYSIEQDEIFLSLENSKSLKGIHAYGTLLWEYHHLYIKECDFFLFSRSFPQAI
jgi:hypothetical protein